METGVECSEVWSAVSRINCLIYNYGCIGVSIVGFISFLWSLVCIYNNRCRHFLTAACWKRLVRKTLFGLKWFFFTRSLIPFIQCFVIKVSCQHQHFFFFFFGFCYSLKLEMCCAEISSCFIFWVKACNKGKDPNGFNYLYWVNLCSVLFNWQVWATNQINFFLTYNLPFSPFVAVCCGVDNEMRRLGFLWSFSFSTCSFRWVEC